MKFILVLRGKTVSALLVMMLGVIQVALLTSCNEVEDVKAATIGLGTEKKKGSKVNPAGLGKVKTVRFYAMGAEQPTIFGGSKTPVAHYAKMRVELDSSVEKSGAALSTTKDSFKDDTVLDVTSDAGGELKIYLKVGDKPGVYKVKGTIIDDNGEPIKDSKGSVISAQTVYLGGLSVESGNKQDGWVGNKLNYPIVIKVEKAPGEPAEGIKLITSTLSVPKGSKVSTHNKETDAEGLFKIEVKNGSKQGKGKIGLRLADSPLGDYARDYQVELSFFAIDRLQLIIKLLGGLAIFIFGMKLMSEGLSLTAGDKMKSLLNTLTKNRFAAAGAGLLTTGLIQSSSACTVMVVGFVNAGLMTLKQAIGVVMGSNIGTTVTAQMISFKLTHLALPAITVGVIIMLVAKTSRTKFLAQILVGFGLLFFGMSNLASPLKELKDTKFLTEMFSGFHCDPTVAGVSTASVLLGFLKAVFVGTLVTVLVQSSSASIGLLLALASAGLIDPYTGFAILLGDNIGTTITAVLASIGTGLTAKRAACAHCLFNITGTVVMIILFFVKWPGTDHPVFMHAISTLTAGDNFAGENLIRYLANCHTFFNVSCTVVFIWFVPVFEKLCKMIVRGDESAALERKSFLEPHLLATPSIAIQQTWAELGYMLDSARDVHKDSFKAIISTPKNLEAFNDDVRHREAELDRLQHAITDYIAEVSMRQLNEEQSDCLPHLVHSVNDAERLGDHSIAFLKMAKRIKKHSLNFSDQARQELDALFVTSEELFDQCATIITEVVKGQEPHDSSLIKEYLDNAYVTMKKLKTQEKEFYKAHLIRQEKGSCDVGTGIVFLEAIRMLLRSGGHIINIIEAAARQEAK